VVELPFVVMAAAVDAAQATVAAAAVLMSVAARRQ